jgi:hypothetical protein
MLKVILKGHPTADFLNAHSFGGYTALHLAYQFKQTAMVDHLEAGLSKCTSACFHLLFLYTGAFRRFRFGSHPLSDLTFRPDLNQNVRSWDGDRPQDLSLFERNA